MRGEDIRRALGTISVIIVAGVAMLVALGMSADNLYADGEVDPAYEAINPDYKVSGSPWMRLPDELRGWPPIEAPEPGMLGPAPEDPTAMEVYDVATGEVRKIPSDDLSQIPVLPGLRSLEGFEGLLPPGVIPESVFPPDDRVQVTNTTAYPWTTVCKLFVTFPDGAQGGCSGAIIGRTDGNGFHVLTAGHCIYSHSNGGWATSVKVYPGLDEDYAPFNYAWGTNLRSYSGWTSSAMVEHDWGVITLDRRVGNFTGWMGRITTTDFSWYEGTFNSAGYPGDKCPPDYTCMYFDADTGCQADEYRHWYHMDTFGGQSGMPIWHYDGSSRYIATVHAYGEWDVAGCNSGTRLNQDKFDRIPTWIESDAIPTDYADLLDDGTEWAGFSPTSTCPGQSFSAWCDVRNLGTATASGFVVSFYASTNSTITPSDHLLCAVTVGSVSPFNWVDANASTGSFPSIPAGEYYVGWIIDSGGVITEFNEANNTAYLGSPKLTVEDEPNAPSGCSASENDCSKVRVTWTDNSNNEDGFKVYRNGGYIGGVGANATLYDDTGASACVTYSYCVTAYNGCGESACSNSNSGTRLGVPSAPTGCAATDNDCYKVRVSWTDNSSGVCGETGFKIYRNGSYIGSAGANATYYDDTGATPCVTYSYYVKATNNCGDSGASNSDNGTRLGVPATPSGCAASENDCSTVRVTWTDNSSGVCAETGFRVYRSGSEIGSVGANATSYNDNSASPCVTYSYCVKAYNGCGESGCSNSDNGTRLGGPSAPSGCAASENDCSTVRVTWTDNSSGVCAETGFRVYRNGSEIGSVGANATSYNDNSGSPCVTYSYCVKAYNGCGESSCSNSDNGTRLGTPTGASGCAATDALADRVTVTWTDNSSGVCTETGFRVYRNGASIGTVGANATAYDDLTATPCVTYSYCVKAYNGCGESACSNSDDGIVWDNCGGVEAPTNCIATDNSCDRVRLTWQDNSDNEDGFHVYREGSHIGDAGANATQYDDLTGQLCTIYEYCVTAYNATDESAPCCDDGVRLGPPTAPSGCAATDDDPAKVRITWTDNSSGACGESGFRIFRDGAEIGSTGPNETLYDDMDAEPGLTYPYCVRAWNECDVSPECCDTGLRPSPSEDYYAGPEGLQAAIGQVGFAVPVIGRNTFDIKGYSLCVFFDSTVFAVNPDIIDTVGTCAAGSQIITAGLSDSTAKVGVVYSFSCPPEIPAGDHPPALPYIKFVLDVKPNASLGMTEIEFRDIDLAKNRMTVCDGSTTEPMGYAIAVEIISERVIRGDDDGNGEVNISDPIMSLCAQFADCDLTCLDASDVDDDGEVTISDPIRNLCAQFADCEAPPAPFPDCGPDPTADGLDCECHPYCMGCGAALLRSPATVKMWLGIPERAGANRTICPIYLETSHDLWGFECIVRFPSAGMRYESVGTGLSEAVGHDFLAAKTIGAKGDMVKIGDVVSFDLSSSLEPGIHEVARLVFSNAGKGQARKIQLVEGMFVTPGGGTGDVIVQGTSRDFTALSSEIVEFKLAAVPNPFSGTTSIQYSLPSEGPVRISIYNISGQEVCTVVDRHETAGRHEEAWDGRNQAGSEVPSGVYFCRMETAERSAMLKVLILK